MLTYDAVVLPSPEMIIVLTAVTFAILLVAIVGIRRRRRRAAKRQKLRRELDRMSARITALELAENRYLLMMVKSTPLVPDHVPETTLTPPANAASSNGRELKAD